MRHGGDLAAAEAAFGRPREGWLDLSTGVNPHAYPVPPFAPERLTRLPEKPEIDDLLAVARAAYGWNADIPVAAGPGAQSMIQLLPYLRVRGEVAVLGRTYGEHAYVWARAGHVVREARTLQKAEEAQVVVVVNPDNPTGRAVPPDELAALAETLAARDGLLVVDEAFADVTPEIALGHRVKSRGMVVLRSFGKFYGLAGLRLGFAAGDEEMVTELAAELGPWPVSGPAIAAGRAALADGGWAAGMRVRLVAHSMRLDAALARGGFTGLRGCGLFRTGRHERAGAVHRSLAEAGIWCRAFDNRPNQLRFGIPGDDAAFERLESALISAFEQAL
jgi:cobalamin biosynthetic protein CobC